MCPVTYAFISVAARWEGTACIHVVTVPRLTLVVCNRSVGTYPNHWDDASRQKG